MLTPNGRQLAIALYDTQPQFALIPILERFCSFQVLIIRFANKITKFGGTSSVKLWILDDHGYDLVPLIHNKELINLLMKCKYSKSVNRVEKTKK